MSAKVAKKLINRISDCVDENIAGYTAMHACVRQLSGCPRVVVRSDLQEHKAQGRVAVLTGGGSGHEPAFAGYIGNNMATGAVLGDVFAAPGTINVLRAIRALGQNNTGGVLLLINNYTGDRLTFGMAAERARAEGIRVEMVINADDTALVTADKTAGRRGIAGCIFLIKIAGSLAEEGKPLNEIVKVVTEASSQLGTLGLCLNACSVPGSGPLFEIAEDEMELGLGLHGEAGVKTLKMATAHETVQLMLQHMTNTENHIHLPVQAGDRVAVLTNNLGSISDMEMNILTKEMIEQLEEKGIHVERAYSGRCVTSQEMPGFSITIIHIDTERKRTFDKTTKALAWINSYQIESSDSRMPAPLHIDVTDNEQKVTESSGRQDAVISEDESLQLQSAVRAACFALIENEGLLNKLDSRSGDADCGSTMKTAAQKLLDKIGERKELFRNPSRLLLSMSDTVEESVGGSSGALYSIFLTAAGRVLAPPGSARDWVGALEAGLLAVRKYGGAEPGDRTMVDPLNAALVSTAKGGSNQEKMQRAVEAAEKEAELTRQMAARAGRASYVSAEHLTEADPGARAVAIWMRALYNAVRK